MIADKRRLRIHQILCSGGELSLEQGIDCWQDDKGTVCGSGLWYDLLVPCPEDLEAQAKTKQMSSLEWLRQKLCSVTYLRIEIL